MRELNPAHIAALMETINRAPYFELLSMRLTGLGAGCAVVETAVERKHLNPYGSVDGGVYASLIDTAAYWAVYGELGEESGFTTIDLQVNNLSAAREGKLVVRGRSLKIGRSICLAEAGVHGEDGRLLAHGTSKLMVLHGKQLPGDAARELGLAPLPQKFL